MPRIIDGQTYLRIGEVAARLKRGPQTIKRWYYWAQQEGQEHVLPPVHRIQTGNLKVWHWLEEDIKQLERFRDSLEYGDMSAFNLQFWGERGKQMRKGRKNSTN